MRTSPVKAALFLFLAFNLTVSDAVAAQVTKQQPLFTSFPTLMLCAESSFVAMASEHPTQLTVLRIGRNGIEEPQKLPVAYNGVYGIKCNYQRVELLVLENGSDHFSRLPFTIRENAVEHGQPVDIEYSVSRKGPMPPEIQDFHKLQVWPRGDWYVVVPGIPRFNVMYELHFVKTQERSPKGLANKLTVDLLEETFGQEGHQVRAAYRPNGL
jgi:hypothetical protein